MIKKLFCLALLSTSTLLLAEGEPQGSSEQPKQEVAKPVEEASKPASSHSQASQGKNCEELKSEIAAKIDQKGVKNYSLSIEDISAQAKGQKVGTCGGGTKQIVYLRS